MCSVAIACQLSIMRPAFYNSRPVHTSSQWVSFYPLNYVTSSFVSSETVGLSDVVNQILDPLQYQHELNNYEVK